jgi:hypothetical protein
MNYVNVNIPENLLPSLLEWLNIERDESGAYQGSDGGIRFAPHFCEAEGGCDLCKLIKKLEALRDGKSEGADEVMEMVIALRIIANNEWTMPYKAVVMAKAALNCWDALRTNEEEEEEYENDSD